MKKAPTVYLETTVPNYVFNDNYPDRQQAARKIFNLVKERKIKGFVSQVVIDELQATKGARRRKQLLGLAKGLIILAVDKEAENLAQKYVDENIFPKKRKMDALHVAIASVKGVDYILSWNFEHIVRIKTKEMVRGANTLLGYETPEIVVPEEVI